MTFYCFSTDSGNDLSTILNTTGYGENFEFKLIGTIDTSETGIHWADISVTDNNTFNGINKVIGTRTYTVKVPYVVQSLKLRDDIPTDANGNPVINTQLSTEADIPRKASASLHLPDTQSPPLPQPASHW